MEIGGSKAVVEDLAYGHDHICATRTSDGYRATEQASGEKVLLWLLRYPITTDSEAAVQFTRRLQKMSELKGSWPNFRRFGVDMFNKAFLITDFVEPRSLLSEKLTLEEKVKLFLDIVQVVAVLHENDIVLGDIGANSFTYDDQRGVMLLGALGPFEVAAAKTTMLPQSKTLHFVSPEQRSSSGVVPGSDVFALGIYGYKLFTERYPLGEADIDDGSDDLLKLAPPPSKVNSDLPKWLDEVLGRALEKNTAQRWRNAKELARGFSLAQESGEAATGVTRWSSQTLTVHRDPVKVIKPTSRTSKTEEFQRQNGPEYSDPAANTQSMDIPTERPPYVMLGVGLGTLTLLFFVVFALFVSPEKSTGGVLVEEISIHEQFAPEELKESLRGVIDPNSTFDERRRALQEIAESDDPVAYAVMMSAGKKAKEPELKRAAQQLLVERVRRHKLEQTSKVLLQWFSTYEELGKDPAGAPSYDPVLRACDATLPISDRKGSLRKAFVIEPLVAVQIAASLALDQGDEFIGILRQFLSVERGQEDLSSRSLGLLLLSEPSLTVFFADKVREQFKTFSASELATALVLLNETNAELLYELTEETLARNIVPPFQRVFLEVLVGVDRQSFSAGVRSALVSGARAEFGEEDVFAIGRWLDLRAERVLFAMCANAKQKEIGVLAFDTLAARSISQQPGRGLMDWIKNDRWDYRDELYKGVAILGLSDIATEEQINHAFEVLMPYATGQNFLQVMFDSKDPRLLVQAVTRFGEMSSNSDLLTLLSDQDKEVRIAAVRALQGRNQLEVLQEIHRGYQREADEDVRAVYKQYHWVTRDREGGS